jgi:hypothetical protein
MTDKTGSDYYVARTAALLRGHDQLCTYGHALLAERCGAEAVPAILAEARDEFAALIPAIPYIGGRDNPLTDTLEQMTSLLALYRVLQRRGTPVAEVGALVHAMAQRRVDSTPAILRRLLGRLYMSRLWRRRTERKALASQQGRYPGNFVFEVVPGDDSGSAWGINYLECGVVKFFHAQGADEFTPYMCFIDFLMFPAMGIRLERQGTLAQGCAQCDFRFHGHGAPTR